MLPSAIRTIMGRPCRRWSDSERLLPFSRGPRLLYAAFAIFVIVSCAGCGAEAARRPQAFYDRIEAERHAGDLPQAAADVAKAFAAWRKQPSAYWHWMFRLQSAEVLMARGDTAGAAPYLKPDVPAGIPSRERLASRELLDRGYSEFLRS